MVATAISAQWSSSGSPRRDIRVALGENAQHATAPNGEPSLVLFAAGGGRISPIGPIANTAFWRASCCRPHSIDQRPRLSNGLRRFCLSRHHLRLQIRPARNRPLRLLDAHSVASFRAGKSKKSERPPLRTFQSWNTIAVDLAIFRGEAIQFDSCKE